MTVAISHINRLLNAQSLAASFNSSPFSIKHFKLFSIQIISTGSPVGNFKLQCSNDPDITNITNWIDIANSNEYINASGSTFYNVSDAAYLMVRLVYTATSGSGSVTATVMMKD